MKFIAVCLAVLAVAAVVVSAKNIAPDWSKNDDNDTVAMVDAWDSDTYDSVYIQIGDEVIVNWGGCQNDTDAPTVASSYNVSAGDNAYFQATNGIHLGADVLPDEDTVISDTFHIVGGNNRYIRAAVSSPEGDLHFYCRAIPAAASCLTGLYVKTDLDSPMPDVPINTRNKIDTGDTKCPGTSCPFKNDRRDEVCLFDGASELEELIEDDEDFSVTESGLKIRSRYSQSGAYWFMVVGEAGEECDFTFECGLGSSAAAVIPTVVLVAAAALASMLFA